MGIWGRNALQWAIVFVLFTYSPFSRANHPLLQAAEGLADYYANESIQFQESIFHFHALAQNGTLTQKDFADNLRVLMEKLNSCGRDAACKLDAVKIAGRSDTKSIGLYLTAYDALPYLITITTLGLSFTMLQIESYYFLAPSTLITPALPHLVKTIALAPITFAANIGALDVTFRKIIPGLKKFYSHLRRLLTRAPTSQEIIDAFVHRLVLRGAFPEEEEMLLRFSLNLNPQQLDNYAGRVMGALGDKATDCSQALLAHPLP